MSGVIAQGVSAWNSGAAVLSFVFPMLLFIAVAGALYILYTKPAVAPGHAGLERPITYTSIPGRPTTDVSATSAADMSRMPAADRGETPAAPDETGTAGSENAAPEGDE